MIKKSIKRILTGLLLVPLVALAVSVGAAGGVMAVAADECPAGTPIGNDKLTLDAGSDCAKGTSQGNDLQSVFKTVANIMLFLVGAVAVIMLIIGGLRYVTSNGDQNAVSGAKNTILYAIIGIVVAFLAFAAVNFVTDQLQQGAGNATVYNSSKHSA